jgi:phosphoesterase RecJ-like protein
MALDHEAVKAIFDSKKPQRIVVVQAENPDGDSLGSAVALDELLTAAGHDVSLFCVVDVPNHLKYIKGWERVSSMPVGYFDLAIVVDNSSTSPMEKAIQTLGEQLYKSKVLIIDHHDIYPDFDFEFTQFCDDKVVATSQLIFDLAQYMNWEISDNAASAMAASILSDSLGLTSIKTTARTFEVMAELVGKYNVNVSQMDHDRKELNQKSVAIINYKAELLQRVEYMFDLQLAIIVVPYEDIKKYSDSYNPSMLVMEELRFVKEVKMTVALKVYPDRITGALRSDRLQVCNVIAEKFGGGGHPFAAGFKTDSWKIDELKREIVTLVGEQLKAKGLL